VIVLDEAQAIPTDYLEPCLAALRELVAHYRCTVLLCTATLPAFADRSLLRSALPEVTEIIDTPEDLYTQLKRVRVDFIGQIANDELARQLSRQKQVLCIVSTKNRLNRCLPPCRKRLVPFIFPPICIPYIEPVCWKIFDNA